MQQRTFTKQYLESRRKKARNQHKHELIHNLVAGVALLIVCLAVGAYALGVWAEHPAEQPVCGVEYLASIRGGDF